MKIGSWGLAFFLLVFLGCTTESVTPRVPVKEYLQQQAERQQESSAYPGAIMAAETDFSTTTKNRVFTEERGYPEYLIGPSDVLEITSWANTKPTIDTVTVNADGTISYSFLDTIMVANLSAMQVDQLLTEKLGQYMRRVRLDVLVKEYHSKSALLNGEINAATNLNIKAGAGKYILQGKTTILDFIVMAGGTTENSDLKNVELLRDGEHYTIDLYAAMFKGDGRQNVIIDHGDVVTVPKLPALAERVYVFGEVNRVGVFALEEATDLLAAISLAGGITGVAQEQDVRIIRGYKRGEEPVTLTANLDALMKDGDVSQNIQLAHGDVVYVTRTKIGDINEFIRNTIPLLDYLLYPRDYRDAYSDPARLRYFMK